MAREVTGLLMQPHTGCMCAAQPAAFAAVQRGRATVYRLLSVTTSGQLCSDVWGTVQDVNRCEEPTLRISAGSVGRAGALLSQVYSVAKRPGKTTVGSDCTNPVVTDQPPNKRRWCRTAPKI